MVFGLARSKGHLSSQLMEVSVDHPFRCRSLLFPSVSAYFHLVCYYMRIPNRRIIRVPSRPCRCLIPSLLLAVR